MSNNVIIELEKELNYMYEKLKQRIVEENKKGQNGNMRNTNKKKTREKIKKGKMNYINSCISLYTSRFNRKRHL
jgi:hypothetical protein